MTASSQVLGEWLQSLQNVEQHIGIFFLQQFDEIKKKSIIKIDIL